MNDVEHVIWSKGHWKWDEAVICHGGMVLPRIESDRHKRAKGGGIEGFGKVK